MKKERYFDPALLVILLGLLLISTFGMSQKNTINNSINDTCLLKSFTAKYVEGNVYINWTVISNIADYYFILEKSVDNQFDEVIAIKNGFISPQNQSLLYCYTDSTCSSTAKRKYKLKAYKMHYEILDGEMVQVIYPFEPNMFGKNLMAEIEIKPFPSFMRAQELGILVKASND